MPAYLPCLKSRSLVAAVSFSTFLLAACGQEQPAAVTAPAAAAPVDVAEPVSAVAAATISGTVSGSNGPEAGVWVIAETDDLGTRYAKVVVTDDEGRFLIPDLPAAAYQVWARGYGLADSARVEAEPGAELQLTAAIPP